jgi:membrane associated rhomboid family serine protease
MAFYDRDYYREHGRGAGVLSRLQLGAVGSLMVVHILVWIAQQVYPRAVTSFLAASASSLSGFHLYKLVTATFAPAGGTVFALVWNLLFLYFLGRELEQLYGRGRFLLFYLGAGAVATLVEAVAFGLAGMPGQPVSGATGAVLSVVVLFTLFYPQRQVIFIFIPLPVWVICAIFVAKDVLEVATARGSWLSSLGHLAGAAVGLVCWGVGLRRLRIGSLLPRFGVLRFRRRREAAEILEFPRRRKDSPLDEQILSMRIDELLEKISREGKDSLSEEEWTFLRENSSHYKS